MRKPVGPRASLPKCPNANWQCQVRPAAGSPGWPAVALCACAGDDALLAPQAGAAQAAGERWRGRRGSACTRSVSSAALDPRAIEHFSVAVECGDSLVMAFLYGKAAPNFCWTRYTYRKNALP